MEEKNQNDKWQNAKAVLTSMAFGILIVTLFFNIKVPVVSSYGYLLGEKKDFTIFFIHASDLGILIFFLTILVTRNYHKVPGATSTHTKTVPILLALLALVSYLLNFNKLLVPAISTYYLLLVIMPLVLHETLVNYKLDVSKIFRNVLLGLGILESIWAILQYTYQSDFGLQKIGESVIGPYVYNVAKVEALGQVFIRGYGSFPHPNILAAFLLLALILCLGKTLQSTYYNKPTKYLVSLFTLHLLAIGLFITFSRAGWLAGAFSVATYFVFTWKNIRARAKTRYYFVFGSLFVTTITISYIFAPFLIQRGNVLDKAYAERETYNVSALRMLKMSPMVGVGPGESIVRMPEYLSKSTLPSEIQPIHNYYLIIAAELGTPFLFVFLIYMRNALKLAYLRAVKINLLQIKQVSMFVGLIAILILMFFDHYFYSYAGTAALFWTWAALIYPQVTHETSVN